jgi:hypothetical protein
MGSCYWVLQAIWGYNVLIVLLTGKYTLILAMIFTKPKKYDCLGERIRSLLCVAVISRPSKYLFCFLKK